MAKNNELTAAVTEAVARTADAAERIHNSVARLPLDVLRRAELVGKAADDLQKLQDHSIGAVYDLVRGINSEVGRLAEQLLSGPERPRTTRAASAKAA